MLLQSPELLVYGGAQCNVSIAIYTLSIMYTNYCRTDALILCIPIPLLWKLQIPFHK